MRAQGWEEPLQRAGCWGIQLVTAPAAAPTGSRQGKEGALVYDFAGEAGPQRPTHARGRAVGHGGVGQGLPSSLVLSALLWSVFLPNWV